MKIWLIRHGKTAGNLDRRYIGITDEPLCEDGVQDLERKTMPYCDILYVSPMLRCIQSASILFPNQEYKVVEELRECNFGQFENQNYKQLSGNPQYKQWIESGGLMPFPEGEDGYAFRKRCVTAFADNLEGCFEKGISHGVWIIHGGSIMSILEAYGTVGKKFYDWNIENGCGWEVEVDVKNWKINKGCFHKITKRSFI